METGQLDGFPGSLGGWHEFNELDYPSYFLAMQYAGGADFESVRPILDSHPVWKSLKFISHLNEEKCSRLFALLLDPRWYIDPTEPEKNTKLESYLGLTPKIQQRVTAGDKDQGKLYDKCKLVMDCWRTGRPTSKEEYRDPCNFIWRIHASEDNPYKADLRASQAFVAFLKGIWLSELYKDRASVSMDGLFVPEYFFNNPDEIDAYKEHIARK